MSGSEALLGEGGGSEVDGLVILYIFLLSPYILKRIFLIPKSQGQRTERW